jgi:hypothetical protein
MTNQAIQLDKRRGEADRQAIELRRLVLAVEADKDAMRLRQEELETQLIAAPGASWPEAAEKARYLIGLLAATTAARDPRRKKLIANTLEDFRRLSARSDDDAK